MAAALEWAGGRVGVPRGASLEAVQGSWIPWCAARSYRGWLVFIFGWCASESRAEPLPYEGSGGSTLTDFVFSFSPAHNTASGTIVWWRCQSARWRRAPPTRASATLAPPLCPARSSLALVSDGVCGPRR